MRFRKKRTAFTILLLCFLWVDYKFLRESGEWEDISNNDIDFNGEVRNANKPQEKRDVLVDSSSDQCAFSVESFGKSSNSECVLPILDPFNEHVMKFMAGAKYGIVCPGKQYTTYNNGVLAISEQDSSVKNITVKSIERKPHTDWGFVLNDEVFHYPKSSTINKEFLQVDIEKFSGEKAVEYHAKVVAKPEVLQREQVDGGLNYSVLMVGFDTTSLAQMQRAMPKVYRFLNDDLKSYIFRGYSIVGDGTTPQLIAMLTGFREPELSEGRKGYPNSTTIDAWPWILKDFRNHGYATMYSEDDVDYNTFNYRLHGFREPPADHYSRTFWQAAAVRDFCVESTPQPQLHLSYVESFMEAYRAIPKFAFAFLSNICHLSMTNLPQAQSYTLDFLQSIKEKGFLDDTILIVFGDHGMRFGETRDLIQGKLEERLPFLSIRLPTSSRLNNKEIHAFLSENIEKLTSPFDIHATLHHILTYSKGQTNLPKTGMSLFRRIPSDRGCSECGIPDHYCPCVQLKAVPKTHPHIQTAARDLVQKINQLVNRDDLAAKNCATLELRQIKSAYQNLIHPKLVQFRGSNDTDGRVPDFEENAKYYECNYVLLVRTAPGGGLFEATTQLIEGKFYFGQHISRINKYGDQPKCIAEKKPYLRKYCFCKQNNG